MLKYYMLYCIIFWALKVFQILLETQIKNPNIWIKLAHTMRKKFDNPTKPTKHILLTTWTLSTVDHILSFVQWFYWEHKNMLYFYMSHHKACSHFVNLAKDSVQNRPIPVSWRQAADYWYCYTCLIQAFVECYGSGTRINQFGTRVNQF